MSILQDRYSRQILFEPIGEEGQRKISSSKILILGCGALGSVSADILARAGVGHIRIVDRDFVELSNLQRQTLFEEKDVAENTPKAVAAARRLNRINSEIIIEPIVADANPRNILDFIGGVDIVVDGLDNFEGRYLVNDACVKTGIPWVYGGCVGSYGLAALIVPGRTPCLRCLFPAPPEAGAAPTCDTSGIIASESHLVASIQTALALRWIVTRKVPEGGGSIYSTDVWDGRFERLEVAYRPDELHCTCCVGRRFDSLDSPGAQTTKLCGRKSVQICPPGAARPDFESLAERLAPLGAIKVNEYLLKFDAPPYQLTIFTDGRVIVKGTTDESLARTLVAKYIGM